MLTWSVFILCGFVQHRSWVKLIVGALLFEFGGCSRGYGPVFVWVSVRILLKWALLLEMESGPYSFLLFSVKVLENLGGYRLLVTFIPAELSVGDSCVNGSAGTLPSRTNFPSQDTELLLTLCLLHPNPPQLCSLPGASARAMGLPEEDVCIHRHPRGWFWGLLAPFALFTPYLKHASYLRARIHVHDPVCFTHQITTKEIDPWKAARHGLWQHNNPTSRSLF